MKPTRRQRKRARIVNAQKEIALIRDLRSGKFKRYADGQMERMSLCMKIADDESKPAFVREFSKSCAHDIAAIILRDIATATLLAHKHP